jgi:hypothetical protein
LASDKQSEDEEEEGHQMQLFRAFEVITIMHFDLFIGAQS